MSAATTGPATDLISVGEGETETYSPAIELAATPIGNTLDASPSLLQALSAANIIAAEDTKRLLNLAGRLGVQLHGRVLSCYDHNERARAPQLIDAFRQGQRVLVVSDAGMPTVSDPGLAIVRAAIEAQVPVRVLPGPSAVLTALAISGFATDRFCFEGFVPRKGTDRKRTLETIAQEQRTAIFFESPRRLLTTLNDLAAIAGLDRRIAVCRELSKIYEEIVRGSISEVIEKLGNEVRGEITVVVEGAAPKVLSVDEAARQAITLAQADGCKLKQAAKQVAAAGGLRASDVYEQAIALR